MSESLVGRNLGIISLHQKWHLVHAPQERRRNIRKGIPPYRNSVSNLLDGNFDEQPRMGHDSREAVTLNAYQGSD